MSFLYLTADRVGVETGGGIVTANELAALRTLGRTEVLSRDELDGPGDEPWKWDANACRKLTTTLWKEPFTLCHGYAGTFGRTVDTLKVNGVKVCWTIAAHDRHVSRREHEALGIPFAQLYPHLCEESLWQRYIEGYRLADVIICPSTVAKRTVQDYGPEFATKRIEVVPHGCELPDKVAPLPKRFTVGYLGSCGAADKGVRYLMEAWKRLAWTDATLLLAGRDSTSPHVRAMLERFGGGNVRLLGWVKNVADFYNNISLYVQPSMTEGFGIEALEALSYGRPVICSNAAGAWDVCADNGGAFVVTAGDVEDMAGTLDVCKTRTDLHERWSVAARESAQEFTWDKIRQRYVDVWKSMIA